MKLLTILLFIVIIWHQSTLKIQNSILLIELMGLVVFYVLGRRYLKERKRSMDTRKALKEFSPNYSKKENKDWRDYTSNVEVKPENNSLKELIQ